MTSPATANSLHPHYRWPPGLWPYLLTYNRNNDKTSTFMDGGPSNRGWGPDLTACLVGLRSHLQLHRGCCSTRTGPKYVGSSVCTESLGLRSHSRSHRGHCSTRTGPKYVGSLVCTESLRMYVEYTNAFSMCFFINTYDTVLSYLLKYISYLQ